MGVKTLSCILSAIALAAASSEACTVVVVGKNASTTGRVIVGHNEDDAGSVSMIHGLVPARDWPAGSTMPAEKGCASIPQVPHTLGFFWSEAVESGRGIENADAFLNERGVLIVSDSAGISTIDTKDASRLADGGIWYNLRRAVAERATSAREAVFIICELVDRWGYVPSGRIYTVADANEGWQVQIASGKGHWAVERCPDDSVAVCPNHYTCRDAKRFQAPEWTNIAHNTNRQNFVTSRLLGREWRDESYPFSARAERKVSPEDVERALSAHPADWPRHEKDFDSPSACRAATVESIVCDFGERAEDTVLHVAGRRPCETGYRKIRPLAKPSPADFENANAAERLANHLR